MKSIIEALCIFFLSMALAAAVHAKDYSDSGDESQNPWIEVYAGLGYYNWKLSYNTGLSGGTSFDNSTQPFILKKFDIRSNLKIIQLGLNYFTNRFDNALNTTDESDVVRENDPLARQLAMFAGLTLGPVVVTTDAKFRKFQGTLRSNGIERFDGTRAPVRLYAESGPVDIPEGMEVTWYSTVKDYTLKAGLPWTRKTGVNFSMEFGGRMVQYSSPTEIGITTHSGMPAMKTTALFVSDITQYFVGMSFWVNYTWASGIYWEWFVPAYLGANKLENSYLEMGPGNTYTFSSTGRMATGYQSGHVRIELGLDYDYFISTSSYTSRVRKDIEYYNIQGAGFQQIDAGTQVDTKMTRMELFWGVYLHATLQL